MGEPVVWLVKFAWIVLATG